MTPGNRPSEGGTACHAMTESYPLKRLYLDWRALGSIIGVWSVQLIRAYMPSRRGWSGTPSMKRAPDPRSELGGGEVP